MMRQQSAAKSIFLNAVEIDSPAQRQLYIEAACAGDLALHREVEDLLRHCERKGSFLESPVLAPGPTIDQPLTERPGTLIGPYKLLQQIGEGGMGIVYMAEQQEPVRRKVALKIIKPGMDSAQVIARFEAERQALAMMDHQNIAKVFDAGTTDTGRPYFVMELVHGVPITKFCDDNQLTPRERLALFVPVCQAIQHAHQKGVIHRDIKPSNVLVTMYDDKPVPKVIDFGVAKAIEQRLTEKTLFTQFGVLVGTFEYMSPEQAEMNAFGVDTRSDIYSLGVLLYELLTGTTPLERERLRTAALSELVRLIREEEPPRPSVRLSSSNNLPKIAAARKTEPVKLSKLIRGEIDWIVMKCLEKERSRRYETANGLARDVERYLHDEAVEACPPSAGYRLRKFIRKYRMPVAVAAAFALLLVAGVVVSAWLAVWAIDAEREATTKRHEAETAKELARTAEDKAKKEADQARRQAYAASIPQMQQAWENRHLLQLQDLLGRTAGSPERGFEWYYLQRLCHVEHMTLLGHTGAVHAVAFSPDGQSLATGSKDGTARIWDAAGARKLLCLRGHRSEVTSLAFAPDGQWLVTGSMDGTAKLWDAAGGHELRTLKSPSSGAIWAVAVTPDGKRVLTGSQDGTARVWDASSGNELFKLDGHTALPQIGASTLALLSSPQTSGPVLALSALHPGRAGHTRAVRTVAVTPDGKRLITASEDNLIMIWDAASGRQLRMFIGGFWEDRGINRVVVTPDGKRLFTAGADNTVRVWDADTGMQLLKLPIGNGPVPSVALTPDGRRLVVGHWTGAASVWDLVPLPDIAASTLGLLSSPGAPAPLLAASLHPESTEMARPREILTVKGHNSAAQCVAVSPDGKRLATASDDGTVRVWDMISGRATKTLSGHTDPVWCVTVTPDGKRIATGSMDGTARVWDIANGHELEKLHGHTGGSAAVSLTPDGKKIITGAADGKVRVWDAVSGRERLTFKAHISPIYSIAVTPDGQRVITGSWYGRSTIWDITTGRELLELKGHTGIVISIAVTPDGQQIVTGGWDGRTKIWDAASGRELRNLPTGAVHAVALTPDGRRIITGGSTGTATVWDTVSGEELFSLKGHTDLITSVAVTPDGQRIVTGSVDRTVSVWDATDGRQLLILKGHTARVNKVAVTPDGRRIVTGSGDGTVKIWEAATPEQVALWTSQEREAARRLKPWQRPSPGTPGFIRDWLILAPLKLEDGETGANGLEREQLREEAKLQPRAADRVPGQQKILWKAHHAEEPALDFNRFVEKRSDHSIAYAVCYVISPAKRNDLLLQVGSQAKVYLNGEPVYKDPRIRGLWAGLNRTPVTLREGTNVLILKVVKETGDWEGCARFVDRDGKPVQGLEVRLTPE